jgi:hypothetical protein
MLWTGLVLLRIGAVGGGSCKLGNEPSGSIKCWELPNGCTTCGLSCGARLHRVSWFVCMYLYVHYCCRFEVLCIMDLHIV